MSIFQRLLRMILGLQYQTADERFQDLDQRLKKVETQASRTERKVYRAEEQTPDINHLQRELLVNLGEEFPVDAFPLDLPAVVEPERPGSFPW